MLSSYEELIEKDRLAWIAVDKFVEENGSLIAHIWNEGDGDGGALFIYLKKILIDAGKLPEPMQKIKGYTKQIIKAAIREDVFVKDNYKCVKCGSNRSLTVDHIHPESLGGSLDLSNLQTLCKSCNSSKGNRLKNG
jgi:hypothetical protein